MTTKCVRLEAAMVEFEAQKERIQSLEMELEMTKINGDRETEQLVE